MKPTLIPKVKKGDRVSARRWNQLVDAVNRAQINLGQSTGIQGQITPFGTILRASPVRGFVAVANGNITARSGLTAGSGNVYAVTANGTTLATDTSISIPVLNASSTTMTSGYSIDSGQYCWCEDDVNGVLWVSPLECA